VASVCPTYHLFQIPTVACLYLVRMMPIDHNFVLGLPCVVVPNKEQGCERSQPNGSTTCLVLARTPELAIHHARTQGNQRYPNVNFCVSWKKVIECWTSLDFGKRITPALPNECPTFCWIATHGLHPSDVSPAGFCDDMTCAHTTEHALPDQQQSKIQHHTPNK
jgi:hypothetical protein